MNAKCKGGRRHAWVYVIGNNYLSEIVAHPHMPITIDIIMCMNCPRKNGATFAAKKVVVDVMEKT